MSWKVMLVVFASILIATSSRDSDCEGGREDVFVNVKECSYHYDLLENALLNDTNNLYRLQRAFFPPNGDSPGDVLISVAITVSEIVQNRNCSDVSPKTPPTFIWDFTYYQNLQCQMTPLRFQDVSQWSNVGLFESVFALFLPIPDLAIFYPYQSLHSLYMYSSEDYRNGADIYLHLDQLPCNPRRDTTDDILNHLFTWAKAYARTHGRPKKFDESDRGKITTQSDLIDKHLAWNKKIMNNFLLAGFVFLNVLVLLLMVRFVPGYYHMFVNTMNGRNTRDTSLTIYWGCALVLFFLAMILHLVDLVVYVSILAGLILASTWGWSQFHDQLLTSYTMTITCISTKVVVMVVELIASVLICKKNTITVRIPFQRCIMNVLFCCCCCCCCSSALKSRVVQTLALWGIMAVVQHIIASLIPLCFAIIIQPAEVLSVLALIASTLFCTIMFVAHLFHLRQVTGRQQRTAFCIQMFAIVSFIGLAIVSIAVYLQILLAGVKFSGLGGFLGSLVPSAILSAVGWYVKTKFLNNNTSTDPQPPQPTIQDLTTANVQHGTTETVSVHQNTPIRNYESDGEQTPLLQGTN